MLHEKFNKVLQPAVDLWSTLFYKQCELLFENYGQKRRTCHSPKTDCWHPSNCPRLRKMSRRRGKDNTSAIAVHSTPRTQKAKSKIEYIPLICSQL